MSSGGNESNFKRQKFWHVQISVMFEGDLLSCDMKVEALSVVEACDFCLQSVALELAAIMQEESQELSADYLTIKKQIQSGIVFKRIVLVTNPAMMCAGGSGMRVSAAQDNGKKEMLAKIEVKESERNKNYG